VRLAEGLIGKGVPLRVYDPDVAIGNVFGRNRAYIDDHLPHVAQLFGESLTQVLQSADVVIVGKRVAGVEALFGRRRTEQVVIDLVGIAELEDVLRPWSAVRAATATL
jgi:GDP-mannose 6-dehydrogenase